MLNKTSKLMFVVFVLLSMFTTLTWAEERFEHGLRVFPAKIELDAQQGETVSFDLSLLGQYTDQEVTLLVTDIYINRYGQYVFEHIDDWKYSASEWIEFSPKNRRLNLRTKTETKVRFTVTIPRSVRSSEYYTCVVVKLTKSSRIQSQGVGINKFTQIAN